MSSEHAAIGALPIAVAVTACATPVMARLATRAGILDRPGGYKRHDRPTPYLGGVAVLLGVIAASLIVAGVSSPLPAIAAAAVVICLLGTLDDWRPVSPAFRLFVQAAVGAGIWLADAGWTLTVPGWVNLLLTVGWVVLAANAFNLLDNLDGTAAAAAAASALGAAMIALATANDAWAAPLALALVGACLAFLPYNLSRPARIFLGDGGSTLLGVLVAVAVMGAFAGEGSLSPLLAAAALAGVPLLDTAVVAISRRRRGVPLLTGGRDHLTHRIFARVGSARRVAAIVAGLQIVLSALVLAVVELGPEALGAAVIAGCLGAAATLAALRIWPRSLRTSTRPLS